MNSHATRNPAGAPSDRAAYVYMPPADGYSFESWPMAVAAQMHAISARPTDSGSACRASGTEMKIEYATAAAGAMCVIDWNSTCGRPIECSRRWSKPRAALVAPSIAIPPESTGRLGRAECVRRGGGSPGPARDVSAASDKRASRARPMSSPADGSLNSCTIRPNERTRAMQQKIIPNLWFDTAAEEAANFYVSVFKNSRIVDSTRYTDAGP